MDNQDNQFDVTTRIMETFFSYINDKNITSYVAAMKIASGVEQYAEMKVEQFKQQQNEVANLNEKA